MTDRPCRGAKESAAKKRGSQRWRANLFWALLGAAAGDLASSPLERAKDWAYEAVYQGQQFLKEGKALRRAAIAEGSEEKHRAANAAFRRAADAGVAEASAQLGIASCLGLGLSRDLRAGRAMIIEAVKRDGRLVFYLNSDVCPEREIEADAAIRWRSRESLRRQRRHPEYAEGMIRDRYKCRCPL